MAKLTVIMPVYNRETIVKEAIDSILCQSYQDFKFLIVDDGSEDKAADIIKFYRDPRIYLIKIYKNLGISTSKNLALSKIKTEFIARMDSYNIAHPDRFAIQIDYLENTGIV